MRKGKSRGGFELLKKRIEESGLVASLDADSVVGRLKNRYPEYCRHKIFCDEVDRVLSIIRQASTTSTQSPSSSLNNNNSSSANNSPSSRKSRKRPHMSYSSESNSESEDTKSTYTSELPNRKPVFDMTSFSLNDQYLKTTKKQENTTKSPEVRDIKIPTQKQKKKTKSLPKIMDIDISDKKLTIMGTNKGPIINGTLPKERNNNNNNDDEMREEFKVGFDDLGGMEGVIKELIKKVIIPLCHPEMPNCLGVRPITGLLLHGPPGCGKTTLAHAIANEAELPFYKISAPEVMSGVVGEAEENIRTIFKKAHQTAPSIVFIDEIDAIGSKRENLQREMERRIVTQLMTCMDQFHQGNHKLGEENEDEKKKPPGYVLVIGATNRPDAVDRALRRPGRFDWEISLGVPDENARFQILSMLTKKQRLEGEFDLFKIARSTPGFVGADLKSLVYEAGYSAMNRIIERRTSSLDLVDWWRSNKRKKLDESEMESMSITMADFEAAAKMVQPSFRREGFSEKQKVTWDDIGGFSSLRKEFYRHIVRKIKYPEMYKKFGLNNDAGFLLFGPPGCGKTLIAKAAANESGVNFKHIKGPELMNKYVGESEAELRKIFANARINSPCILFFDEVDALAARRGEEGAGVADRLLNTLLIELDGADQRPGVFVIGATNRIEVMDPAVLRPGRFGEIHYVPLPSAEDRLAILKAHARNRPIDPGVDLASLARDPRCNNLTGADLSKLMYKAAMAALDEWFELSPDTSTTEGTMKKLHFESALSGITPSVSQELREYYEALSKKYKPA